MFVWRLMVKGFLLVWGWLHSWFHGFLAFFFFLICALARSLLLPVSLPHPSDSPAAYLGLMKDALWGASPTAPHPFLTSSSPAQSNLSEASWKEISLSANSSSPVQFSLQLHSPEGVKADGWCNDWLSASIKGVWRDKGRAQGLWTIEQQPAVTRDRDSRQRNSHSEQITYSGCQSGCGLYSDELRSVQIDSTLDFKHIVVADKTKLHLSIEKKVLHCRQHLVS